MFDFTTVIPYYENTAQNRSQSTKSGSNVFLDPNTLITHHGAILGTLQDVNDGVIPVNTRCDCPAGHGKHSDGGKGEDYAHVVRLGGGDGAICCSGNECEGLVYIMDKPKEAPREVDGAQNVVEKGLQDSSIIAKKNRLVNLRDIIENIPKPEWTIEDLIPNQGLLELFGESTAKKTFVMLDMLYCISAGIPYHGLETKKKPVVYVTGEGGNGIAYRLRGFDMHYNAHTELFYQLPMPANLGDVEELALLADEIKELTDQKAVIIFDTLHRCSAGLDEDKAKDFAIILGAIDRTLWNVADVVGWVHHTGLDTSRGRGTSSRFAGVDVQIHIKKSEVGSVLENTKQKDAEELKPMVFTFKKFDTGKQTKKGKPITTLIPQLHDGEAESQPKLNKAQKEILELLENLIHDQGSPIDEEVMAKYGYRAGKGVSVDLWRTEAIKIIPSSSTNQDSRRRSFDRHKNKLIDLGMIVENDGIVFCPKLSELFFSSEE